MTGSSWRKICGGLREIILELQLHHQKHIVEECILTSEVFLLKYVYISIFVNRYYIYSYVTERIRK